MSDKTITITEEIKIIAVTFSILLLLGGVIIGYANAQNICQEKRIAHEKTTQQLGINNPPIFKENRSICYKPYDCFDNNALQGCTRTNDLCNWCCKNRCSILWC